MECHPEAKAVMIFTPSDYGRALTSARERADENLTAEQQTIDASASSGPDSQLRSAI
jgi:hypothetical protein